MNLTHLSPEDLANLKAQLDTLTDVSGRSPVKPRQLHNLSLAPTARDPRPTFVWSAESPRDQDVTRTTEFPKLLFHQTTGEECCVRSKDEELAKLADPAWGKVAPVQAPVDPMEAVRSELASLSPEDRTLVIEMQRQERIQALKAKMAALPEVDLESLLSESATLARGKKKAG